MGRRKWSPVLKITCKTILCYSLTISRRKGCHVGPRVLQSFSKVTGVSNTYLPTKEEYAQPGLEYKRFHPIRVDREYLRATYMESLAQAWEDTGRGRDQQ